MSWESPRGPISIDPETRDIVQNVYIRKVEKKNGELYNVEFATFPSVKDPVKAAEEVRLLDAIGLFSAMRGEAERADIRKLVAWGPPVRLLAMTADPGAALTRSC